jgi:hypothetical protein
MVDAEDSLGIREQVGGEYVEAICRQLVLEF